MSSKIKKFLLKITGTVPVFWNVMKKELEDEKENLKKNELKEWELKPKNWRRKAEFDDQGNVIIPARWLKTSLIISCKQNRVIPHFATRKNETYTNYVNSMMFFNTGEPFCKKEELEGIGCYVGGQGLNSSTRIWQVKPSRKEWEVEFEIIDPIGRIRKSELREIIEYAGLMVGIGSRRTQNFGRFEITSLEESK